ncbi:MAG: hypothetical protein AAB403_13315 [Planctomycetota bacterium]
MAESAHYTHTIEGELQSLSRTGLGQHTSPGIIRWISRSIFFGATRRLAQAELALLFSATERPLEELRTIHRDLLPGDHADFPAVVLTDSGPNWKSERIHYVEDWHALELAAGYFPAACELRRAMLDWTSARRIAWPWFLDGALLNLVLGRPTSWSYPGSMCVAKAKRYGAAAGEPWAIVPMPAPRLDGYEPLAETRSEYLDRQLARLKAYCDARERLLGPAGLPASASRRRRSGTAWVAVDWFVRNRIQGERQEAIAEDSKVTSERISTGITEIENLLT